MPSNLPERIEAVVRAWPHWSRAERRRMDAIVEEVLHFCRTGEGVPFIADWCRRELARMPGFVAAGQEV